MAKAIEDHETTKIKQKTKTMETLTLFFLSALTSLPSSSMYAYTYVPARSVNVNTDAWYWVPEKYSKILPPKKNIFKKNACQPLLSILFSHVSLYVYRYEQSETSSCIFQIFEYTFM